MQRLHLPLRFRCCCFTSSEKKPAPRTTKIEYHHGNNDRARELGIPFVTILFQTTQAVPVPLSKSNAKCGLLTKADNAPFKVWLYDDFSGELRREGVKTPLVKDKFTWRYVDVAVASPMAAPMEPTEAGELLDIETKHLLVHEDTGAFSSKTLLVSAISAHSLHVELAQNMYNAGGHGFAAGKHASEAQKRMVEKLDKMGILVIRQPSNSPETNLNDLALFNASLQRQVLLGMMIQNGGQPVREKHYRIREFWGTGRPKKQHQ